MLLAVLFFRPLGVLLARRLERLAPGVGLGASRRLVPLEVFVCACECVHVIVVVCDHGEREGTQAKEKQREINGHNHTRQTKLTSRMRSLT
jgi:hypothetical protein